MKLRLGFHYHLPALSDGGSIRVPGHMGRFLDSLASHCEVLVCFLHRPLPGEVEEVDYELKSSNVVLVDIGPKWPAPLRELRRRHLRLSLDPWKGKLDALLLRGPSPLLPTISGLAQPLPSVLLLVGDYLAVSPPPRPLWRCAAIHLWARWNNAAQTRVARGSLTLVNSRRLYEQLRPVVADLVEVRTTILTGEDFYDREDTCPSPPCRLLYAGRVVREKGVEELLDAFHLLVQEGEPALLDIVGKGEPGHDLSSALAARARLLGLGGRVRLLGHVSAGPELFAHYRAADAFLLASRSDTEGFPRVLWEAMAHSLPIVATRVGAIPDVLTDGENALLIAPKDPAALAAAARRLLNDAALRRRLIRNGRRLAKENTLETQTPRLVEHIASWLRRRRGA